MHTATPFMILLTALVTALVTVPQAMRLVPVLGGVDQPDARKVHRIGTPRLGGIAIMASLVLAAVPFMEPSPKLWGFLGGATIMFLTGLVDDLATLSPGRKFVGQLVAAGVAVKWGEIELGSFGDLFGTGELQLGIFSIPVTMFAIVGLANAINLLDGLDGLAAGVCALASATFALLAYASGNTELLALCLALLGAVLGFLKYNTHPARIFMGDSGSLLLGYCMGVFSIMLVNGGNGTISEVTPLMILAVPIFDTVLVMGKRFCSGRRLFSPDNSHFHHRLLSLCHRHQTTVRFIHGFCYVLSGAALASRYLPDSLILAILLALYGVLYVAAHEVAGIIGRSDIGRAGATIGDVHSDGLFGYRVRYGRKPVKSMMMFIILLAILIPPQPQRGFGLGMRLSPKKLPARVLSLHRADDAGVGRQERTIVTVSQHAGPGDLMVPNDNIPMETEVGP